MTKQSNWKKAKNMKIKMKSAIYFWLQPVVKQLWKFDLHKKIGRTDFQEDCSEEYETPKDVGC